MMVLLLGTGITGCSLAHAVEVGRLDCRTSENAELEMSTDPVNK